MGQKLPSTPQFRGNERRDPFIHFKTCLSELHRLHRSLIKRPLIERRIDPVTAVSGGAAVGDDGLLFRRLFILTMLAPAVIRKNAIDRRWPRNYWRIVPIRVCFIATVMGEERELVFSDGSGTVAGGRQNPKRTGVCERGGGTHLDPVCLSARLGTNTLHPNVPLPSPCLEPRPLKPNPPFLAMAPVG